MLPPDVYRAFMEAGTDWADKHGAAEMLESSLKSLKAKLTIEEREIRQCSMVEAGDVALASDEYRNAARTAVTARVESNKARVRYDATKALWEATRTAEASERAAMRSAT